MRNLFFLLLISASSVWAKDVYSQVGDVQREEWDYRVDLQAN